jgi:hypothetical protein
MSALFGTLFPAGTTVEVWIEQEPTAETPSSVPGKSRARDFRTRAYFRRAASLFTVGIVPLPAGILKIGTVASL